MNKKIEINYLLGSVTEIPKSSSTNSRLFELGEHHDVFEAIEGANRENCGMSKTRPTFSLYRALRVFASGRKSG